MLKVLLGPHAHGGTTTETHFLPQAPGTPGQVASISHTTTTTTGAQTGEGVMAPTAKMEELIPGTLHQDNNPLSVLLPFTGHQLWQQGACSAALLSNGSH